MKSLVSRDFDYYADRFFDLVPWKVLERGLEREYSPDLDLIENPNEYVVKLDLPGIESKDIDINVKNNVVTVIGKRQEEKKEENGSYCKIERKFGSFSRSFSLTDEIDYEKIDAVYKNGVLSLKIPKSNVSIQKRIKVKEE